MWAFLSMVEVLRVPGISRPKPSVVPTHVGPPMVVRPKRRGQTNNPNTTTAEQANIFTSLSARQAKEGTANRAGVEKADLDSSGIRHPDVTRFFRSHLSQSHLIHEGGAFGRVWTSPSRGSFH